ncbi:hypermethylated in cancer 1 protein isoform X1 [Rhinoraja longicauda]
MASSPHSPSSPTHPRCSMYLPCPSPSPPSPPSLRLTLFLLLRWSFQTPSPSLPLHPHSRPSLHPISSIPNSPPTRHSAPSRPSRPVPPSLPSARSAPPSAFSPPLPLLILISGKCQRGGVRATGRVAAMIIPPLPGSGRTHLQSPGGEMMPMLDAMEVPNHAKQLLLQLNRQRTKGFLCDVIIVVQNALFRAHKNILAASSVYLKSLVVHDNLVNLDPEMVSPGTFRTVLDYIYTGRLNEYEQGSEQSLGAILAAASYLQLPDLVALCKKRLKRNGSYLHIRSGLSSYGKLARGLRTATPVIQSCYSVPPRLMDGQPLHTINTNSGELYAPPSQGSRLPDQAASQLLGLDLSKRSPHDEAHSGDSRQTSPPAGGAHMANGALSKEQAGGGLHPMETDEVLGPEGGVYRGGMGKGQDEVCHWFKQEPLPSFLDECQREKGARGERQERRGMVGTGGPGLPPPPLPSVRYPGPGCEEAEDEKSSSEETSSDEPGASGATDRYQCGHLGYDPEHFGDNLYVCIPCGKGFPSSEQLNAHVESHTEDDLFHKELADPPAPFADKPSELVRPYRCSSCDKSYKDPATLRQHEKSHWLTRPYPCNICGKKFTQRGTMTRHMRSHLGLKPFACEACGMRFTRQYRLTEHMRIHSGEKPYECQICGGKFAQQRNLISHMKMHTADCKPKLDFGDGVYPLAKFAAAHLGFNQDKAVEILSQGGQLGPESFSPP